jgi:methylated-DNA-[protein]-cysteine S-methyltransferase
MSRARPAPRPACHQELATPLGRLLLAATDSGLAVVHFHGSGAVDEVLREHALEPDPGAGVAPLERAAAALEGYFAGELRRFELKLDLRSGTAFERRVWREAQRIAYGKVINYGDLATRLGMPLGARAVGRALGRNPLAIVVPCHRVVQQDGSLGGYSSGVAIKRWLLGHEGFLLPDLGLG